MKTEEKSTCLFDGTLLSKEEIKYFNLKIKSTINEEEEIREKIKGKVGDILREEDLE